MTAAIATIPVLKFFDGSIPAAGGTVTVYEANTLTPAVTWNDRDQATIHQNANPLTLNANGEGTFFLESGKFYDFLVKNSLGATIGNPKGVSGSSSGVISLTSWQSTGLTPTFVSTRSFSLVGNQTAEYHVGRRVRTTNTGGTKYATIISSVFSSVTTVTLGFQNNTDVLDAGLSAVDYGIEPYVNPAIQQGNGSILDLTGYSGADIVLGIGQSSIYTVTAITSLLLRIATGDNQEYEISVLPTVSSPVTSAGASTLQPNNANTGAGAVTSTSSYQGNGVPAGGVAATNAYQIDAGLQLTRLHGVVSTKTICKTAIFSFFSKSSTSNASGMTHCQWNDTTTAQTSLGTMNWVNAITGLIRVTRKL